MTRSRRRAHALRCACLFSGMLHAGLATVATLMLQPRDPDTVGELILTADEAPDELPLESLGVASDGLDDGLLFGMATDSAPLSNEFMPRQELDRDAPLALSDLSEAALVEIVPPAPEMPDEPPAPLLGKIDDSGLPATFFGNVAYGDEFVYVLDKSGSMSGRKFERASSELLRSVDSLKANQAFYVILFDDRAHRMFNDERPQGKPLAATAENKRRLREWLMNVNPDGGTDPSDALHVAMRFGVSAVFLLSDGEFNPKPKPKAGKKKGKGSLRLGARTAEETVERHKKRGTPVHTIAFESPSASQTMQALAEQTGGDFRFVAAPPNADEDRRKTAQALAQRREAEAMALLQEAKASEASLRWMKTMKTCQAIVNTYPDTAAARQAEEIRQRLTLLESP